MDAEADAMIYWVGDVSDPFVPYPKEGLMLNLSEDRERIDAFLDKILAKYHTEERKQTQIYACQGAALAACKQLLDGCGGKIVLFSSGMAQLGVGQLKNRNDVKLYNNDSEKTLFQHTPAHDFYTKLGNSALKENISFEIYIGAQSSSESIDLASLNQIVQMTGGDLIYFGKFNTQKHGEKLYYEFFRNVTKNAGYEVSVKARCSKGFTVTEYFGAFGCRESVDFKISAIDADKSFGFQLRNDAVLTNGNTAYVQVAVLYSDIYQRRRLRIFNSAFQVTDSLHQYYKSTIAENFASYFMRQKISKIDKKGPKNIREEIINHTVALLAKYRQECSPNSAPSQLVIPEGLKLLPIYILSTMKSHAFRLLNNYQQLDEKVFHI